MFNSGVSDIIGFLKILKLLRISKALSNNSMRIYKDLLDRDYLSYMANTERIKN